MHFISAGGADLTKRGKKKKNSNFLIYAEFDYNAWLFIHGGKRNDPARLMNLGYLQHELWNKLVNVMVNGRNQVKRRKRGENQTQLGKDDGKQQSHVKCYWGES